MNDAAPKYFIAPSLKPNGEIVYDKLFESYDEAIAACERFEQDFEAFRKTITPLTA